MKFKEGKVIEKFYVKKNGKNVEVIIRFPRKSDARQLMNYINSIFAERAHISNQKKVSLADERRFVAKVIDSCKRNRGRCVVAESGGKIVSMSDVHINDVDVRKHVASLGISVHREYRRLGIAQKMMKKMIKFGKSDLKAKIIILNVYGANKAAYKLYIKLGFVKVGLIPNGVKSHGKYCDDIIMMLKK